MVGNAFAYHPLGADLSYQCLDPTHHVYKIILTYYHDCREPDENPDIALQISSASCHENFTVIPIPQPCPDNLNGEQPCEITPLCYASIAQSECNGGHYQGMEAVTYLDTVTLPQACTDWVFSFDVCCRGGNITNLMDPESHDLYVEATLNNALALSDNSPQFTTIPIPYICANQPFSYNLGTIDADGDSLVYSLISPMDAGETPITYENGYSVSDPLSTNGIFSFNTANGQLSFTPAAVQIAVITVLVKEYRLGQLIGTMMRDIEVVVYNLPNCALPPPVFSGIDSESVHGGILIGANSVRMCPGGHLSFSTQAIESSGDSVFSQSNIVASIPGAQYNTHYVSGNSIVGNFEWTPDESDTGQHNFVVTVSNHACPLSASQATAITVDIFSGVQPGLGYDTLICKGDSISLFSGNGSAYSWKQPTGLSCTECSKPIARPDTTSNYQEVITDPSTACKTSHHWLVMVQNLTINPLFSDTFVVEGTPVQLGANPTGGDHVFTYDWQPSEYLNSINDSQPVSIPYTDITYTLAVSSGSCAETSQINIHVRLLPDNVFIPNVFTPNGDGNNDYFMAYGDKVTWAKCEIAVFDRTGERVFESRDPEFKWDGTFKGTPLLSGVYIYRVVVVFHDKEVGRNYKGSLTLLR